MIQHIKKYFTLPIAVILGLYSPNLFATELTQEQVDEMDFQIHGIGLFSGNGITAEIIEALTDLTNPDLDANFSHVALIMREVNSTKSDKSPSLYCFESTGSVAQILKGNFPHVRISPLNDIVKNYNGCVAMRQINFKKEPNIEVVTEFVRDFNGYDYEKDPSELILSLTSLNPDSNTENGVFCSEAAALGLIKSKLMKDSPANNFIPENFSESASLKGKGITLINGASFQKQFYLKDNVSKFKKFSKGLRKFIKYNFLDVLLPCFTKVKDISVETAVLSTEAAFPSMEDMIAELSEDEDDI